MGFYKNTSDPIESVLTLTEAIEEYDRSFKERFESASRAFFACDEDALYLLGPSSYLISLMGEKIAVDPQVRRPSDFALVKDAILRDFKDISAILITHEHDDHFCTKLTRLLKDEDIVWYLPAGMRQKWVDESELPPEKIRFVREGDSFAIGAVTVSVFNSPHVPFGMEKELVERGYELSCERGRILIPGDIREYAYTDYPPLAAPDLCIAHVWAGNDSIHPEEYLPKMDAAADFFARFGAKRYFLGHLYEIARDQMHMWDTSHADLLSERIKARLPHCEVQIPTLGCGYRLFSGEEISE